VVFDDSRELVIGCDDLLEDEVSKILGRLPLYASYRLLPGLPYG
jgi:hypothetical protein